MGGSPRRFRRIYIFISDRAVCVAVILEPDSNTVVVQHCNRFIRWRLPSNKTSLDTHHFTHCKNE
jgi:hypothetical protein